MLSQSNPNIASRMTAARGALASDASPGLASLAPPTGAYFGRWSHTVSGTQHAPPFPPNGPKVGTQTQTLGWRNFSDFFVYWINGSTATPGSYLVIQRQQLLFTVTDMLLQQSNLWRGWMLSDAWAWTVANAATSGTIAIIATSPNAGDQYSSVRQGMTLKVDVGASGSQPRYIEVSDHAPLSLQGWATANQQFYGNSRFPQDTNFAQWYFRQVVPWDPQAAGLDQGNSQGDWTQFFFSNGACVPLPDISQSSLAATTYSTWMITNSAWTQDAPPSCTLTCNTALGGDVYAVWAPGATGQDQPAGHAASSFGPPDVTTLTLPLDQIVKKIPASSAAARAMSGSDVSPGLASLAPPTGAYFGRWTNTMSGTQQSPSMGSNAPLPGRTQTLGWQSFGEFFVYWINGSASTPGAYLIIQRQSLFFSIIDMLLQGSNLWRGWMLSDASAKTVLYNPSSGGNTAVLVSSPNAGDQYSSISEGRTFDVDVGASGSQPRYVELSDQAPLSLPGWAMETRRVPGLDYPYAASWHFHQIAPWDPQAALLGQGNSQGDWTQFFFSNNACVPFPDISQSSLSATTYASWIVYNDGWTQSAPPACTVTGYTQMIANIYAVWAPGGAGAGKPPGYAQSFFGRDSQFSLPLDQIVKRIPASS